MPGGGVDGALQTEPAAYVRARTPSAPKQPTPRPRSPPSADTGSPGDIAATVSHLVSDAGRNITGASIAVDGGFTA
jgi:NAD(P)-dependent dehydrogenase (short-subunit alcohol dehydrogenase family)